MSILEWTSRGWVNMTYRFQYSCNITERSHAFKLQSLLYFCCWSVESQQSYSQLGMMLKLIDSMFMGSFTPMRVCPFLKPADPLCISFLIWWSSLIRVVLSAWSGVWRTRPNAPQSPWYSCRSVDWTSVIMEPFHFCTLHLCFTVILW